MKHLKHILRGLTAVILLSLTTAVGAREAVKEQNPILKSMDSVQVSLLTCGPGQEVYSLYGHTAIRFHDIGRDQDLAINYGMFSFQQKNFILRFVFGITDYEMAIQPFNLFIEEYRSDGRWVKEQTLNLSREEKWAITQAIDENYRPENKVYRYNYFYDNCTTRARDMIVEHITGNVSYAENRSYSPSYRSLIHDYTHGHPWMQLGNDLLLGVKADAKTNQEEQQFLPVHLENDFDNAIIINKDGSRRKLVAQSTYLLPPVANHIDGGFPLSPIGCALVLAAFTIAICFIEAFTKKIFWGFDALWLLADGLCGLIILAMVFSQHPTVSLNFQILILCPLSIVFLIPVVRKLKKHQAHGYLNVLMAFLIIALFLGIWQKYDVAMYILALILLIRIAIIKYWCKKPKLTNE